MLNEPTRKLFKEATEMFGEEHSRKMLIEECAEMTAALCHFERGKCEIGEVMEELADLMISCMKMSYDVGEAAIDIIIMNKMERLKKRVETGDPGAQE